MKRMIAMLVLALFLGSVSMTALVGCKSETKSTGTTTKAGDTTGSTEKKETTPK